MDQLVHRVELKHTLTHQGNRVLSNTVMTVRQKHQTALLLNTATEELLFAHKSIKMTLINFEENKVSNLRNLLGGGSKTDGGTKNPPNAGAFCYDSDYSTWEPGSKSWKVSYYGITPGEDCPCYC